MSSTKSKEMCFAVAGLRQGLGHIESLLKLGNCRVIAVCDLERERIKNAQKILSEAGHPPAKEFHNLDDMLANISADGVCLAMPIHLNAESAIKSLKAGFHTFCEKPAANNIQDALELKKVVKKTGLIYQVGFELRHSPLIQAVMNHINSGCIGQVTAISGYHFWRPYLPHIEKRPWAYNKFAGSVLMDCMSHTFDLVNLFFRKQSTEGLC